MDETLLRSSLKDRFPKVLKSWTFWVLFWNLVFLRGFRMRQKVVVDELASTTSSSLKNCHEQKS